MPKRFKLQDYAVDYQQQSKQLCVLVTGDVIYYKILKLIYKNKCKALLKGKDNNYDWGTYIDNQEDVKQEIEDLLHMLQYAVCIADSLKQSFALDYYYQPYWDNDEGGKTLAGDLVHKAKYDKPFTILHQKTVDMLCDYMERFIRKHKLYQQADLIVSMPYFGHKDFDLPSYLAQELSRRFDITNASHLTKKTRATQPQKSLNTVEEKTQNMREAFKLESPEAFKNKTVIIIDDVYRSGITIQTLAQEIIDAGGECLGLVGAKTIRG